MAPDGQIPDEVFLAGKMEKLYGTVRYRRNTGGNSVKIESSDPAIKDALVPILA